jgi:hypothetical protein
VRIGQGCRHPAFGCSILRRSSYKQHHPSLQPEHHRVARRLEQRNQQHSQQQKQRNLAAFGAQLHAGIVAPLAA